MGAAYYPVLNPPIAGLEPHLAVGGKAIARAMPLLTTWARESGVCDLMSFYSESNEESFATIGEPVPEGPKETPITWFDPADGLTTIRAYLHRLSALPAEPEIRFNDRRGKDYSVKPDALRADLEGLESVVVKASEHGSRFRLRIDI